jgi:coiled-coil domain-containing protein 55
MQLENKTIRRYIYYRIFYETTTKLFNNLPPDQTSFRCSTLIKNSPLLCLQVAEMHAAALAEDASVFDYDSHFDSIQEARAEPKRQEKMARESRYIASLLETAEERKREQDVQYERQLAKERAAEDHLYGNKEKFVTAAYKKKLEEEAKWKAVQKQKQADEEQNAVEKKGHMGDFYRNILRNNVAFGTAATATTGGDKERTSDGAAEKAGALATVGEQHNQANKYDNEDDEIMPERRAEMAAETGRAEQAAPRQPIGGGGGGGAREAPKMDQREELVNRKTEKDRSRDTSLDRAEAGFNETSRREEGGQETGAAAVDPAVAAAAAAAPSAAPANKKSREDAVAAARERYLARKRKAENIT